MYKYNVAQDVVVETTIKVNSCLPFLPWHLEALLILWVQEDPGGHPVPTDKVHYHQHIIILIIINND